MKDAIERMKEMDLEKLRFKMRYLNCIPETLEGPCEIWLHPETNTKHYFKRYEGDITIIVKAKDSVFEDFEVIEGNFEYIDSLRRGVLLFVQKLD